MFTSVIDEEFLEVLDDVFKSITQKIEVKEALGEPIRGEDIIHMAIKFSNRVKENKFGAEALIKVVIYVYFFDLTCLR